MPSAADSACHASTRGELVRCRIPLAQIAAVVGRCSSLRDTFGIALEAS
jgi:hypothetical protein